MAQVFISYSYADEALRDELEKHLAGLLRQGVMTTWHDRRMAPGEELHGRIDDHLNTVDIVLLLVSADFLASDYCHDVEMSRAMERHERGEARVIPVILRPCDWHGAPFGSLMAMPPDGKPVVKNATQDCCSASSIDHLKSKRINTFPRRSASNLHAEQQSDRLKHMAR